MFVVSAFNTQPRDEPGGDSLKRWNLKTSTLVPSNPNRRTWLLRHGPARLMSFTGPSQLHSLAALIVLRRTQVVCHSLVLLRVLTPLPYLRAASVEIINVTKRLIDDHLPLNDQTPSLAARSTFSLDFALPHDIMLSMHFVRRRRISRQ